MSRNAGHRTTPSARLFDPKTVAPKVCPTCGTNTKSECGFDRDASEGIISGARPRGCLNQVDPRTMEIPY